MEHFDEVNLQVIQHEAVGRLDANESLYFARQLEYVRSKLYEVKRPQLNALQVFPIDSSIPEGADIVTYTMYDATGVAKIIASYADDLPMVGVNGKQYSSPIRTLGIAYGWSTEEVRKAAMTGMPLSTKLATMAKRGNDIKVNQIAWFGDAVSGLPGFFTNTNIPLYTVPATGTGASQLWSAKTPDQILADMNGIVNSVTTQTQGVHKANELWLPLDNLVLIKNTIRSAQSDSTIYKVFLDNNPGVIIRELTELKAVPQYANKNVMVAIENTQENLELILPMPFRDYPPQMNNLAWKVPAESRIGGVVIQYPLAMAIGSGI